MDFGDYQISIGLRTFEGDIKLLITDRWHLTAYNYYRRKD